jgi:hypothetical protein
MSNSKGRSMAEIRETCLCGSVQYAAEAEPAAVVVCHCVTCQKNTGSAFSLNIGVPTAAVTFARATLARYEDLSGAGGKPFYRISGRAMARLAANGDAYPGLGRSSKPGRSRIHHG